MQGLNIKLIVYVSFAFYFEASITVREVCAVRGFCKLFFLINRLIV